MSPLRAKLGTVWVWHQARLQMSDIPPHRLLAFLLLHYLLLHSNSSITFTKKTSNSSHSIHMNSERLEKLNKKQLKHFSLRQTLIHSQVKTEKFHFFWHPPTQNFFVLSFLFCFFFVRDMNTKSTYSVYGAEIAEFDRKIVWHPSCHSCCLKWKQDIKVRSATFLIV